jgi:hypothetical protein
VRVGLAWTAVLPAAPSTAAAVPKPPEREELHDALEHWLPSGVDSAWSVRSAGFVFRHYPPWSPVSRAVI